MAVRLGSNKWAYNESNLKSADLNDTFNSVFLGSILGDGSDGDLEVSSGTTTLEGGRAYNYSSITISEGAVLTISNQNKPLILRCKGDVVISGTIDLKGKGGDGGASTNDIYTRNDGEIGAGIFWIPTFATVQNSTTRLIPNGQGGGGGNSDTNEGGCGGGGGNRTAGGQGYTYSGGGSGGAGGCAIRSPYSAYGLTAGIVWCGSGGGSGGAGYGNEYSGRGGNGGGGLLIIAGGDITIGTNGVIDCSGEDGANGSGEGGGGGGGGSGGTAIFLYKGSFTNNGSVNVSGGDGGRYSWSTDRKGGVGGEGFFVSSHLS